MAGIRKILCPVDFSDPSRHAIEHAVAAAMWFRASISALHVYTPVFAPVPALPAPEDRIPDSELMRVRSETEALFAASGGDRIELLVDVGRPAQCILDRAASLPADLIVMGTHGASGFERFMIGSVTERVLRKALCPVLTVPPRAAATSRLPFTHVLCAIDFSEPSIAGLHLACAFANESASALTLLHAIEWPWDEPPPPSADALPPEQAAALAEYRRYLTATAGDRLAALARGAAGCAPASRVVHGKAYVEILRVAAEIGADLIVMGVHGRHTADLMLFGSTTNQVVRRASCPVLTLRR